jgi:hypothetical protein
MYPKLSNIITTSSLRAAALLWLSLVVCGSTVLLAHGGFDHVTGTVAKVDNNTLTVKTAKGDVDVRLNDKTEITRGDQKAAIGDLKPGARVVVDLPEGVKNPFAHSVKVGVAGAAAPHDHDTHDHDTHK